jgi:heparosan-N-sulfate-glucuronate 5-epimerase
MEPSSFPIAVNPETRLQYYLHSDTLFGIPFKGKGQSGHYDAQGIPVFHYKWEGVQYNPAYVAWWGLANLNTGDHASFLKSIDWLHRRSVERGNGVVWEYRFDWVEGKAFLQAPWISAMSQGLAISALVRSWRLFGRERDLHLAGRASEAFRTAIEEGGVQDRSEGLMFLEEYPARPFPRILDGFCFALLGLHDLAEEFGANPGYARLFESGLDTLEASLPAWDFQRVWSWYGRQGFLCTNQYHGLNRAMLLVLHTLSGREAFHRYYTCWDPDRRSALTRLMTRVAQEGTLRFRRRQYNRIRMVHLKRKKREK